MNHLASPFDSVASESAGFPLSCVSTETERAARGRAPNSPFIYTCAASFSASVIPVLSNLFDYGVSQPSACSDTATVPLVLWKADINIHVRHMYMSIFKTLLILQSSSS